jgi:hypothetical protein
MSYDWTGRSTRPIPLREVDAVDLPPALQPGLAFQSEVPVNWCPALGTVLANEEVIDGRSERGNHPVIRTPLRQWMLKITAYADRSSRISRSSTGPRARASCSRVDRPQRRRDHRLRIAGHAGKSLEVFTTRPDTLFGATFCVLAPEHPLVTRSPRPSARPRWTRTSWPRAIKSDRDRSAARPRTRPASPPALLREPGHRREGARVGRRLRALGLRHGRDHGRARPRRARLRVREEVQAP